MLNFGNSHTRKCLAQPHRNAEHQLRKGCSFRCDSFFTVFRHNVKNEDLTLGLFMIRGIKVMFDKDLAELWSGNSSSK
jgi:hypothetical protein